MSFYCFNKAQKEREQTGQKLLCIDDLAHESVSYTRRYGKDP